MEEKRREVGSPSPSPSTTISSSKNLDSPATEPPPPRRRGQKRKSSTSNASSAPPKRHAREKAAAAAAAASGGLFSSLLPPIHNGPLTRARQLSDNNAAIFSALNAVKNDHSMASANDSGASEGREEVKAANEEYKKFQAQIDAEVHAIRSRDSKVHVVPVAAGWFSWTNIHSIEKQTMRSFFNGKLENRTPEIYKEIRNWIMKRFHANPSTNIELNDLSDLSIGDIDARQEILEFLDHWGLINYHPFPQDDPANVDADPNTDVEKEEKTDSLIEKLFQFENEQSYKELVPRSNMSTASVPSGLFPESIAEELVKQEGPAVEYHCNSCSADCSRKRYHCQKQADFDLCSECYNNGKFGSGMCPSDFILMEPAEVSGGTGGKWTDQETLLLLEALELYKENWNEIAEHVATKTKAQCILHFLQMPIEDSFLDYNDSKDSALENGEPTSTNNELPVAKDNSEPSEGGISKDNSGPAETGSDKDNSGPAETGSGKDNSELLTSKSSKENPDSLEKKTESNAAQPVSTQRESSNLEDAQEGKVVDGKGDDVVIKALKEAFHVAGCPLTPEDNLSFAEAGNSVMALTAFLSQLVEPGLASVSARSSLKTISDNSPESQLAISHCFILEDPLDDEKEHVVSESMATEKNDQIAPEMAKEELVNDKEISSTKEKPTTLLDGSHSTEGQIPKEENTKDESQVSLREQDKCATNSGLPEKPDEDMAQVTEKPDEKSQLTEKPDEEIPQVTEKPDEEKASVTEKSGEEKCLVTEKCDEKKSLITEKRNEENSPVTDKPTEEKTSIPVIPNEEKSSIPKKPHEEKSQVPENADKEKLMVGGKGGELNSIEQVGTKSVNETHNSSLLNEQSHTSPKDQVTSESEVMPPPALASESDNLKTSAVIQCTDVTKDTVMEPSCAVPDKTEQTAQEVMAGAVAVVEASEAGEDKMEVDKTGDTKPTKTAQMKDEDNVTKLKRAALATLSAAAVKSKLLANQEEDEIRQLATILIEKQMRKLEVKLSYFSEMESSIMRVRDQLERSRQKLFNERAHIIASRLGIPPTTSRMLPSSYPVNRMPPGLLNSMLRPPMNMGAQRPLMSRPNVTSTPPPISTSAPPEVAGGSPTQSSAVDKPSSVGQTESLK